MTKEQIFEKVQNIIVEHLEVEKKDVQPQTRLGSDLGADSLDDVEMVMAAEHEFGIYIPDEVCQFSDTTTVQECCNELEKIINQQNK